MHRPKSEFLLSLYFTSGLILLTVQRVIVSCSYTLQLLNIFDYCFFFYRGRSRGGGALQTFFYTLIKLIKLFLCRLISRVHTANFCFFFFF